MSQSFNLNIDEYNIKELEGLLSLSFPYTKEDVKICGQKMKAQLFADPNFTEISLRFAGLEVNSEHDSEL